MLVRNERLKLFATYLNGLGIALFAVGGLAPLFSYLYSPSPTILPSFIATVTLVCLLVSGALHLAGSLILTRLQS